MRYLLNTEFEQAAYWFEYVAQIALNSSCKRAKCGSVIVSSNKCISAGYNSPPANLASQARCNRKHELGPGFKSDRTCCIHAEQRAIMNMLLSVNIERKNSTLYFVRLDEHDRIAYSSTPYCTICSKMSLDSGIQYFSLWHKEGIALYTTEEYNNLSYEYGK